MRPREVSPYKLNLFLQCPRQYYFEYLDPQISPIKKQIKKKRAELEMGENPLMIIRRYLSLRD
jgi:hypothetical protein